MAKFKSGNCFWPWYNKRSKIPKEQMTGIWKAQSNYLRTRCLWRDYLTPSRNRRSGYTDERLRHHRTYGGASDSQLLWCDDTGPEVVGQLADCKDALDHVVVGANPAGSERRLAAKHACIIGFAFCSCLSGPFMFLKWDAFLKRAKKQ